MSLGGPRVVQTACCHVCKLHDASHEEAATHLSKRPI